MGKRAARRWLAAVLTVSLALRVGLVFSGGQLFWPDESRYVRSVLLRDAIRNGDTRGMIETGTIADHTLSIALGVPAAALHGAARSALHLSWSASLAFPALLFALFSVVAIGLVFALARRLSASPGEALTAAILAAASGALFFYARHLLAYDAALVFALLALFVGAKEPAGFSRTVAVGLLASCCFLTYNGYWPLALVALTARALADRRPARIVLRALVGGAAFLVPIALLAGIASQLPGPGYVARLLRFSATATFGDFAEGWRLVGAYLWHAERGVCLAWALGIAALVHAVRTSDDAALRRRGTWAIAGLAATYFLLAVPSTGLHRLAVYGRLARQTVPFLCLAAAAGAHALVDSGKVRPRLARTALVLVVLAAAANFAPAFLLTFPREFRMGAEALCPDPVRAVTAAGTFRWSDVEAIPADAVAAGAVPAGRCVLVNAQFLFPVRGVVPMPPGRVRLSVPHPLAYAPFQYEGWGPRQRAIVRAADLSMRLIDDRPGEGR
jgi:hypothetical protein